MQATEKKSINKIWLSILSVGVVIAIVLLGYLLNGLCVMFGKVKK